jgi:signal transduction histidine kinase
VKERLTALSSRYTLALRDYLVDGGEATLLEAYELGRTALGLKLGILEVAALHQEALVSALKLAAPPEGEKLAKRAAEFFVEAVAPHEMSRRGELEAKSVLSEIVRKLEEKVRTTQEELDERARIERLKDEFVSVVSHEFRTPLTSIQGSLGLLRCGVGGGELSPKARRLLDLAQRNVDRLVRLVNDILDLQRLASDGFVFDLAPATIGALLDQAMDANLAYAAQVGVALALGDVPRGARVRVDPDRFLQVMANLTSNAVKHSAPGEAVTIDAGCRDGFVRVNVSDRGPGIPAEFRHRIFQRFAQAEPSLDHGRRGSGLGLSIAKAIVERLEGRIGFEDREAGGTTFFFELPQWEGECPEPPSPGGRP